MSTPSTPRIRATTADLLGSAFRIVRTGGTTIALIAVLSQVAIALIAVPVMGWLVHEALSAAGLSGIDMPRIGQVFASPFAIAVFVVVLILGYLLMLGQLMLLVVAARHALAGEAFRLRTIWREFAGVFARLVRPSSLGLMPYLLVILPLAGFGFLSVITRTITVPSFISGELMKSVPGIIGWIVFLLIVGTLNTRYSLTLPLYAATALSGRRARKLSFRLTKAYVVPIFLAVLIIALASVASGFLLLVVSIAPTMLMDAVWPEAAPVTAAIMLGIAVTAGIVVMASATVMVVTVAVRASELALAAHPNLVPLSGSDAPAAVAKNVSRRYTVVTAAVLVGIAGATAATTAPLMFELSRQPSTLVLAHRGFSNVGVENTIGGLDGAANAGSDLVEMDVMQTADGGFVVMHDANLSRLAGKDVSLADLTVAQATKTTVRDLAGHSDVIPSLEDYLAHADAIGQKLLIEIKLHGRETSDFLKRLVSEIDEQGVLANHIYHSLDPHVVEDLKRMRPALTVGYTMAFAGSALPQTSADFVVIEEWSYSTDLNAEAHRAGLGMFVWTVNDEMRIRQLLRDGVDGIITDHPDIALAARTQMNEDPGMAPVLFDAIMRFVTIF